MKKSMLSFMLILALSILGSVSAFAESPKVDIIHDVISNVNDETQSDIYDEMLRYAACSGGGKHTMYGKGACTGWDGPMGGANTTVKFTGGQVTQCSKCKQVLATQMSPYWPVSYLGWYTMVSSGGVDLGTGYRHVYANDWSYNSSLANDAFFKSFEFRS